MTRIATVSRDPFSRVETVRRTCGKGKTCAWCGQPARFEYGEQGDSISGRVFWDGKVFCSIGCRGSYHA